MQITHEAERHLSQSKKEDDDEEDDDKESSKNGKAKIIVKLKMSPHANFKSRVCFFKKNLIQGINRCRISQSL